LPQPQTADKVGLRQTGYVQGLKPIDSIDLIGTTEVVPFYKTLLAGVLHQPEAGALALAFAFAHHPYSDGNR
jgi:hypothetical protein